jgi:hypothetical protein
MVRVDLSSLYPTHEHRTHFWDGDTVFSSITNKMQCYTIPILLQYAVHVSGSSSTHHQELTNYTYGIWYLLSHYCYISLPWRSWNSSTTAKGSSNGLTSTRCRMYSFWTPDDGWRNHLNHVQHFAEIKELCNIASCWLFWKIHWWCTDPWTSKNGDTDGTHCYIIRFSDKNVTDTSVLCD